MQNKDHWNNVYQTKNDQELGWYENSPKVTLEFLSDIQLTNLDIFITGAGTTNLIDELKKENRLILNDISEVSLKKIKTQFSLSDQTLLHSFDLGEFNETYACIPCDLWIDRAVLHFLTSKEQIDIYFHRLKNSIRLNGHIMLAEFAIGGAEKCSGLMVHQYSIEEYQKALGEQFKLIKQMNYTYTTPGGSERPYVYGLFQKII